MPSRPGPFLQVAGHRLTPRIDRHRTCLRTRSSGSTEAMCPNVSEPKLPKVDVQTAKVGALFKPARRLVRSDSMPFAGYLRRDHFRDAFLPARSDILRPCNLASCCCLEKSSKSSKASKAGIWYKIGTKFLVVRESTVAPRLVSQSSGVGRIEHTPLHCSHLFIRPPRTWTIPSTAPIGVAPPKRGCRFA
jgi:hypothetical protein